MKFYLIVFICVFFVIHTAQSQNSPTTFESKRIIYSSEKELFYLKGYNLMKKSNHDTTKIVLTPTTFDSTNIFDWHNIELIDSFIFTIGYYNYGFESPPGGAGIVHFYNFECKKHNRAFKNQWDWFMPGGSFLGIPEPTLLKYFKKERFDYDFVKQEKQFLLITYLTDTMTVYRSTDNMKRLPFNEFEILFKTRVKKLHKEYFLAMEDKKTGDIDIYFDTQGTYTLKMGKRSRLDSWLFKNRRLVRKDKVNHTDDFYFYDRVENNVYILDRVEAERLVEADDVEKAVNLVRRQGKKIN